MNNRQSWIWRSKYGTYRENSGADCRNIHISITVKQMSAKYNMATCFNSTAIYRYSLLYLDQRSIVGSGRQYDCCRMLASGIAEESDWFIQLRKNILCYLPCNLKTQHVSVLKGAVSCAVSYFTHVFQHTASNRSSRKFLLFVTMLSLLVQRRAL
jgi:hypothetical protein